MRSDPTLVLIIPNVHSAWWMLSNFADMLWDLHLFGFSSGAWFQCQAEEGFLECGDALWYASTGCLHHPVVGEGPARKI